jgi:hypothetical protein
MRGGPASSICPAAVLTVGDITAKWNNMGRRWASASCQRLYTYRNPLASSRNVGYFGRSAKPTA